MYNIKNDNHIFSYFFMKNLKIMLKIFSDYGPSSNKQITVKSFYG